ncbi:MAG: hypothetical protein EA422_15650 [Gemmatimonadales bacterium]|nr:MAG: hypothetical protein EA422_15650 [Gemmatimonadales bacterium]
MWALLAGFVLLGGGCSAEAGDAHGAAAPGDGESAVVPGEAGQGAWATPPVRVLFVGNSYLYYNDSLHNHLRRMVEAADPALAEALEYKSATIGGSNLLHHNVDWLTRPGRIGVEEPFEVVVLQDHSAAALSEAREADFRTAVVAHDVTIRGRGGRTVLYMTHAYADDHRLASPDNIRRIEALYSEVGAELGALVIPVGLAFEAALRRDPTLRLHNAQDHSHPSLEGSYLAAATVFASLYRRSPVGNSYDAWGAVDGDVARFLQEVAHETVEAYLGVALVRD